MRCALSVSTVVLLLLAACAQGGEQAQQINRDDNNRIKPYAENPRYWQYEGEPVLLIGGSKEDNLFQIPGLEEHLDLLASVGGNYVRNTMSSRDEGNVWPFYRLPNGKYDLNRLNDEYYERFENLLRLAHERDIIVQIELWDRFDFAREPWLENPFRPANNINYTAEESGLKDEYPEHPGSNSNPFFRSVPSLNNNELLLKYQQARVDRLLEIALQYPNVLYCMDNETSAQPEWGTYWSDYIQQKAKAAGVDVQTTEMWDAWDLKDDQHKRTLDHPEQYSFVDISQNNHNKNQEHWENLQWVRNYTADQPRPLNNVKIYGADTGEYGTDRDGIERFWRSIIGVAASVRFHRPSSGLGLSEKAQVHIRSARMLTSAFDLFRTKPDAESRLLSKRSEDEAYLSYLLGEQYAVYFTDGGTVQLDLSEAADSYHLRWLNLANSQWQEASIVHGSQKVSLKVPAGSGHWIALLEKE